MSEENLDDRLEILTRRYSDLVDEKLREEAHGVFRSARILKDLDLKRMLIEMWEEDWKARDL